MSGWSTHRGQAVCLPVDNIDTDQLIPARFMSVPRADGYGRFLLHDLRYGSHATADPDFVLNRFPVASVLVGGNNFGTGSSREAAVYALVDAGIHVVVASGFGDIFAANAVNNGLLPAHVESGDLAWLQAQIASNSVPLLADLSNRTLSVLGRSVAFALDESWRVKLINGWDDVDLTLRHIDQINDFRIQHYHRNPWALPAGDRDNDASSQ